MPLASTAAPPAPLSRWLLGLVLLIAAGVFLGTLRGGFLGDDFVYVSRFYSFPWASWPRLFVHEWSEGIWGSPLKELRPFAALSFMVDARLFGGNAFGFRAVNLLLHLGCVACVMLLARRYSGGSALAAASAGLIFALHPAHAEAVAWITGRVDLLATLGALIFWTAAEVWSEQRKTAALAVSLLACFVGLFAKELFLLAPLLLGARWVMIDFRVSRATWWRRARLLAGAAACIIFYALCRQAAFGANAGSGGAPWRDPGSWARQSSYLGWLVPILPFSEVQEFSHPLALGTMQFLACLLIILTVAALAISLRRRDVVLGNLVFFSGFWYLATIGGLLVIGYFSPRHLYFPSAGLAIGAGIFLARWRRWAPVRALGCVGAAVWLALAFFAAVRPWRENGVLSGQLMAALHEDLEGQPLSTLACIAVPEISHTAWLWSWSSPQLFFEPFFSPAHPGEFVLERTGNYFRPDDWVRDRHAVAAVQAAPGAMVLAADSERRWQHRRVSRGELQTHLPALRELSRNGLTTEGWTTWVHGFFPP